VNSRAEEFFITLAEETGYNDRRHEVAFSDQNVNHRNNVWDFIRREARSVIDEDAVQYGGTTFREFFNMDIETMSREFPSLLNTAKNSAIRCKKNQQRKRRRGDGAGAGSAASDSSGRALQLPDGERAQLQAAGAGSAASDSSGGALPLPDGERAQLQAVVAESAASDSWGHGLPHDDGERAQLQAVVADFEARLAVLAAECSALRAERDRFFAECVHLRAENSALRVEMSKLKGEDLHPDLPQEELRARRDSAVESFRKICDAANHAEATSSLEKSGKHICTISQALFEDPVIAGDGHTYERENILAWIAHEIEKNHYDPLRRGTWRSPVTREYVESHAVIPNLHARSTVSDELQKTLKNMRVEIVSK